MVHLVAKADFTYATKALKVGDLFEASEKDAKILKLAKRAGDPSAQESQARGRRYNRRDMQARD